MVSVSDGWGESVRWRFEGHMMKLRCSVVVTPPHPPPGARGPAGDSEVEEEGPADRVVLVERDGSAQVMVFPERGSAHVFLADGTVATGDSCGVYQVG